MSHPAPEEYRFSRRDAVGRLFRLVGKELSELLRDRRTIITLVLMPLLLYPLLAIAFQQVAAANVLHPDRLKDVADGKTGPPSQTVPLQIAVESLEELTVISHILGLDEKFFQV